ncbi:MAG: GNAT family N-acetyltransferase [Bacteroidales bacterium]|nr:GNAT family N-acetyltransferase [Bacteroidales bacterium]
MKIVKAEPNDLVEVLFLLQVCVNDMNQNGFKHWNNAYPGSETMIEAINNGTLFLYKDKGVSQGMVVLSDEQPEEYQNIEWQASNDKVMYLKFLAVHPLWQGKGIAKMLIGFAEQFAREHEYTALRADIYSGLPSANGMFADSGFSQTGQFHSSFQTAPYHAYEKSL